MTNQDVRKLTESEIDAFPGDSGVNVAIRSSDGVEYYGDACADYPEGDEVAQFVTDEDGDYIPVQSRFERIEALARAAQAMSEKNSQQGEVFIILADCGGGDDLNPHTSLKSARSRIQPEETGIEIWKMSVKDYRCYDTGEVERPPGECVFSRW